MITALIALNMFTYIAGIMVVLTLSDVQGVRGLISLFTWPLVFMFVFIASFFQYTGE